MTENLKFRIYNVQKVPKKLSVFLHYTLYIIHSPRGQTLVEAILAIAIAVVIVTALVTLALGTQKAANNSRNQTQNTKYGEQTIEIIRNIRDTNKDGAIKGMFTVYGCPVATCKFSDLFGYNFGGITSGTGEKFTLAQLTCNDTTTCWALTRVTTTGDPILDSSGGGTIYKRDIVIKDTGSTSDPVDPSNTVKTIEVTISWTDAGGPHNSTTVTKLTNFK